MKKIVNNKLYDTEKAVHVLKYDGRVEAKSSLGYAFDYKVDRELYRSHKGNWFTVEYQQKTGETIFEVLSGLEARTILHKDIEAYIKYFGPLEEA